MVWNAANDPQEHITDEEQAGPTDAELEARNLAMVEYAASDAFGCMTAVEGKAYRAGWEAGRDWAREQDADAAAAAEEREAEHRERLERHERNPHSTFYGTDR